MEPALKLDRLAQLRAELDAGIDEAELLEREKLSHESFRAACSHWDAKLAEEAEQRRSVLTTRYNTAFNVKRRLLAAKRRPDDPPAPAAPTNAPAPVASPPPAPPAPSPPKVPEPIASHLPPVARPVVMAPPVASEQSFAPSSFPADPPIPPAAAPARVAPHGDFSGTMISDEAGGSLAEAMPFLRPLAQAAGIRLPPAESTTSSGPLPAVDGGSTVTLDDPAGAAGRALPFLEAARAARASAKQGEPAPLPPPLPDYSGTLTIDPQTREGAAALPFMAALREQRQSGQRAATPTRRFSLEQFAALTAQIAVAPENIAEVRQRWGLTEATHRSESEAWQQACAADPPLFERYTTLVRQLRAAKGGR